MGSSSSHWYLWIAAAVAGLFVVAAAVQTAQAAQAEVRLRPVADQLLEDIRLLRAAPRESAGLDAQEARAWLDEAQAALDNGRGRTAVRCLRHALARSEHSAGALEAVHGAEWRSQLDAIRKRVDEADQMGGPFQGPPLKA